MGAIESIQQRAEYESRVVWGLIFYNQAACAREISESVDEPALLIEQIIKALNAPGSLEMRYDAVESLISDVVRKCANDQAEAAHNHVMRTPA
jgi:hypothetical protein